MALDWGKEISLSKLRGRKARPRSGYPEKTHMNLLASDQRAGNWRRTLPAALVIFVVVALFVKFGVVDFYARVADKQAELANRTQVLSAMIAATADYDDVLAEYESYESSSMVESGLAVDALDVLSLVDRCVSPYARVSALSLESDTLSLKLANSSLDQLGKLVAALEGQAMVANVNLSTAGTQGSQAGEVSATVTVTLQSPAGDDGGEG